MVQRALNTDESYQWQSFTEGQLAYFRLIAFKDHFMQLMHLIFENFIQNLSVFLA